MIDGRMRLDVRAPEGIEIDARLPEGVDGRDGQASKPRDSLPSSDATKSRPGIMRRSA